MTGERGPESDRHQGLCMTEAGAENTGPQQLTLPALESMPVGRRRGEAQLQGSLLALKWLEHREGPWQPRALRLSQVRTPHAVSLLPLHHATCTWAPALPLAQGLLFISNYMRPTTKNT